MAGGIDEILAAPQYCAGMRRAWLTLLLAFSLAASGLAGVAMAADCPMAAAAQHDCCPDGDAPNAPAHEDMPGDMDTCVMGLACRAAPIAMPTAEPSLATPVFIRLAQPVMGGATSPSGPLAEFWRPPRTI